MRGFSLGASVGARTRTESVGGSNGIQFHHGRKYKNKFGFSNARANIKAVPQNATYLKVFCASSYV